MNFIRQFAGGRGLSRRKTNLYAVMISLLACAPFALQAGLLDGLGLGSDIATKEKAYSCVAKPPAAPPAQFSGGEGVPPLPLPAVPLRRSEKKNPPRPPVLIAKIATAKKSDWATNPGDADNLLRWMAEQLNVNFSAINLNQEQIPENPADIPLLYRTGHDAFSFTPEVREKLRSYLLRGGALVFDACCGRRAFVESALREMEQLVPERPPYRLPGDHPLFRSFSDIHDIHYREWAKKAGARDDDPGVIGIDVGCRTAVFLFRWDVSCGWDNLADSKEHHCLGYTVETARQIGANLMAYITAEKGAVMPLSKALSFVDANQEKSGKFIIGQVKYAGQWRTRDAGLSMLLNTFHEQTKTPVRFALEDIALDSPRLFDIPFLYLTGHDEVVFTEAERVNLRRYLRNGGMLFAEACCGRESFDRAFRREMKAILPETALEILPPGNAVFMFPNRLDAVQPRPALVRTLGSTGKVPPKLLGVTMNGQLSVIYSPWGLACGWELAQCPYCQGLLANDALSLGVNILTFAAIQ